METENPEKKEEPTIEEQPKEEPPKDEQPPQEGAANPLEEKERLRTDNINIDILK
jgi:hypothetical protein